MGTNYITKLRPKKQQAFYGHFDPAFHFRNKNTILSDKHKLRLGLLKSLDAKRLITK